MAWNELTIAAKAIDQVFGFQWPNSVRTNLRAARDAFLIRHATDGDHDDEVISRISAGITYDSGTTTYTVQSQQADSHRLTISVARKARGGACEITLSGSGISVGTMRVQVTPTGGQEPVGFIVDKISATRIDVWFNLVASSHAAQDTGFDLEVRGTPASR